MFVSNVVYTISTGVVVQEIEREGESWDDEEDSSVVRATAYFTVAFPVVSSSIPHLLRIYRCLSSPSFTPPSLITRG